uniref:Uncharacterized protein n=1 Tax=Romanomermis culicivorax TaxID=13658 RepID=A0A915L7F7_ROMCU
MVPSFYLSRLQVAEARYNILKRQSQSATNANLSFTSHETAYDGKTSKAIYGGVPDLMDGSKKRLEAVHRILQNPPSSTTGTYRFSTVGNGSNTAAGLYQRHHSKFTSVDSSFAAGSAISPSPFSKKSEYKHEYGSLGRHSSSVLTSSSGGSHPSATALFKQRLNVGLATSGGSPLFAVSSMNASTNLTAVRHPRTQSSCETLSSIYLPSAEVAKRLTATAPLAHREFFTSPTRRSQSKTLFLKEGKLNRPRSADDHLFSREGSEERNSATTLNVKDGCKNSENMEVRESKRNESRKIEFFEKPKNNDGAEDDENFDFVSSTIKKGDLAKLNRITAKLTEKAFDNYEEELFDFLEYCRV